MTNRTPVTSEILRGELTARSLLRARAWLPSVSYRGLSGTAYRFDKGVETSLSIRE
jgi:hypothetical protein